MLPQTVVQTRNICLTFDSNTGLGHQHRPQLQEGTKHGSSNTMDLDVFMASGGNVSLSGQHVHPSTILWSSPDHGHLLGL